MSQAHVSCVFMMALLVAGGCATSQYQAGHGWRNAAMAQCTPPASAQQVEVQTGRPQAFVDGTGWVLGIPSKLLLWDRRANNHHVTDETVSAVVNYLDENQLSDVCVRVNQYAPGQEWRRLAENHEVGAGWRYTVGAISVLGYTLIPGRLVGHDRYNPYTNSVYVYSDLPALAVQSAAYAKDVHRRTYPGTYAAVNELPAVGLWHETIATQEALAYFAASGTGGEQVAAVKVLHPYYGTRVGGAVEDIIGIGPLAQIGGAVVGHVTAQWQVRQLLNPSEHAESAWVRLGGEDAIEIVQH